MVERSLSASPFHWLALGAVAFAAVLADQLTKQLVSSTLALDHEVHIVGGAESERERIHGEIRRLRALEVDVRAEYRAFLVAALDRLEGGTDGRQAPGQAA